VGGWGSGRPQVYAGTVGDSLSLRVSAVLRWCVPAGVLTWNRGAEPLGAVTVHALAVDRGALVREVRVLWREHEADAWHPREAVLRMVSRAQPFGGVRWRWACPRCARRRETLHKLGGPWACRACLGLTYGSRRESPYHRAQRQLEKVGRRLGLPAGEASDWGPEPPDRPPRMRWWTYERLAEQWDAASERGNAAGWGMILRLMGNSPGGINE
jgi:hypothetical protein